MLLRSQVRLGRFMAISCFRDSKTTMKLWRVQATIITQLQLLRNLPVVVAVIIPNHDGKCIRSFQCTLKNACLLCWHGHSVAGTWDLLLGVHSSCMPKADLIELRQPLPIPPQPIAQYLWEPFNQPEHSICLGPDNEDFCSQDVRFLASDPPDGTPTPTGVIVKYYIHGHGLDESILCGAAVTAVSTSFWCGVSLRKSYPC